MTNRIDFLKEKSKILFEIFLEDYSKLFDIDKDKINNNSCKLSKQMKQRFNKILPMEILNKYNWISNDFDYYLINKIKS